MSSIPADRRAIDAVRPLVVPLEPETLAILRRLMYRLAREQDAAAADQAALIPYWQSCPLSVVGIRAAAQALREAADALPEIIAEISTADVQARRWVA